MLTLTKIRREWIIDHVMPSDLDDKDIKHGLQLKEKMLLDITDEKIKEEYPDWEERERAFRKDGTSDIMDKIMCGELTLDNLPHVSPINVDVWLKYKPFSLDFNSETKLYDFETDENYSEWIKQDDSKSFNLTTTHKDIMVQLQIVMDGDNHNRYFPYQSYENPSGWDYVDDNLKIYDTGVWDRNDDGTLMYPIEDETIGHNDVFYKLFFRNKKGYSTFNWYYEDEEWNAANYPGRKVTTILCDPFRVKYNAEPIMQNADQSFVHPACILSGRQWLKCTYKCDMMTLAFFLINYNISE